MFDPVTIVIAAAIAVAFIAFIVKMRRDHDIDDEDDSVVDEPKPAVKLHFQPATLTFGESYTASWNSYKVEALMLTWTGPDGGNAGMSLSVPSGSVTNPTGPVGTYDFTLVGTDITGTVVARTTAKLEVLAPIVVGPSETAPVAEVALAPIVVGPTPALDVTLEADLAEKDPIVIGPTPAVKKPVAKKPAKKAAPKKPAKKAAPKKR
jgi:hypothetical protein